MVLFILYDDWIIHVGSLVFLLSLLIYLFDYKDSTMALISFLIMIVSFIYVNIAIHKQANLGNKYGYVVTVSKGRYYDIYYTNEYEIENGVIYFNGNCANNFTVEIND